MERKALLKTQFCVVFKILICLPTSNLFNNLKQRYSNSQVRELNFVSKWRGQRIRSVERIAFLQKCLDNSVVPRDIYEKVKKLRPCFAASVGRAFIKNELSVEEEKLARVSNNYLCSVRGASQFLRSLDWIRFNRMLGDTGFRLREKLRKEYSDRVCWLREQRFGSEELSLESVFNLSSVTITPVQLEVLSRGPKFGLPRSVQKEEILGEFELYFDQIRPLVKDRRTRDGLKAKVAGLAHEYADTKHKRNVFPLGKEHLDALHQLKSNKELVITKPDKGTGVVLLDKQDYVAKMMSILNDSTKFERIGGCAEHDNTGKRERALQAFLLRLKKDNQITQEVYNRIRPTGSIRPRLYGLPKVHKPHPVPLRPILSMAGSAQHEIARWLNEILKPVLEKYSKRVVKDSFTFCEVIGKCQPGEGSFMCSFDIKSLFTNIPLEKTIGICLDALYRSDDITPPGVEEKVLRKLLIKCTQEVEFSFNGDMYRQVDGVAMGSPLGPVLANIFVGYCEFRIPENRWPKFYRRYVDDTFSLFCAGKPEALDFSGVVEQPAPIIVIHNGG